MSGAHAEWPFTGRGAMAEAVVSSLADESSMGALVTGDFGIGKTALMKRALRNLDESTRTIRVRGTYCPLDAPYGALSFLLTELDEDSLRHPSRVLDALTRGIEKASGGGPAVVFVDNSQELDALSAAALAQLAIGGVVKLAITCENISDAPVDFVSLWHGGYLTRTDLGPLTERETGDLLSAALGAPASASAVQRLWEASGGNPLYVQALTRELIDSGDLVESAGHWSLTDADLIPGRFSTDVAKMRLGELPPSQREAVEMLAMALTLPLEVLSEMFGVAAIDALEDMGLVRVQPGAPPLVMLVNPFIQNVVRRSLPVGRSGQHRNKLIDACAPAKTPPADLRSFAIWTLECGAALVPETAVRAARAANDSGEPTDALRILDAAAEMNADTGAVIERVRALIDLHSWDDARTVLQRHHASDASEPSMGQWVNLELAGVEVERWSYPGGLPQAAAALADVRGALAQSLPGPADGDDAVFRELVERVELADAELASFQGRYQQICRRFGAPATSMFQEESMFRLVMACRLSDAYAQTGRQLDGIELANDVLARLSDVQAPASVEQLAYTGLFTGSFFAGEWPECHSVLESRRRERSADAVFAGSIAELGRGLLYAHGGQPARALELLVPAVKQLVVWEKGNLAGLGFAAASYSYALLEDGAHARSLFKDAEHCNSQQSSWPVRRSFLYFMALATAHQTSKGEAIEQLLMLADEEEQAGTLSQELFVLSAAVRFGHTAAAGRLAHRAAGAQGSFAQLCRLYGLGLDTGACGALLEAAELAASFGNELFSADAARAVLGTPGASRQHIRAAKQLLLEAPSPAADQNVGALKLTERELEIARLAATGATSREIADQLSVSVRTVEGHLYQVFTKLKLNSRTDLVAMLG